jgi:hypothetical protein
VKDRQSGALVVAAWPNHSAEKLDPPYVAATVSVRKAAAPNYDRRQETLIKRQLPENECNVHSREH